MKMNVDCMRDVLKQLEEMPLGYMASQKNLIQNLPKYDKDEIQYSCMKLYEAGMIAASIAEIDNLPTYRVLNVLDITYKGHDFLAKTRDDERWKGIKKALPAVRDYSIDAINAIANGIASAAISAYVSNLHSQI